MVSTQSDKHLWLAEKILNEYPQCIRGLKFFTLECGCIYYYRVFRNGVIGPRLGIYRDRKDSPCEICMCPQEDWEGRVVDECVVFIIGFEIEEVW